MEKFQQCIQNTTLQFNEKELKIIGHNDEYEGISTILYDAGKMSNDSVDIMSYSFLEKLWLLELSSCTCDFFVDQSSLSLCVLSDSDNDNVLLILN